MFAQKYNFPIENGTVVITETLANNNDEVTNFQKVKTWINGQGFKNIAVNQEETNKRLSYLLTKNTKNSYNPFAGQFIEDLIINFTLYVEGNTVTYAFQNMQIQETYAGYGVNNKITPLVEMLNNVQAAEQAVADAIDSGDKKAAKKAKKENEDIIENGNETLEKASKEITQMQNALRSLLK